MSADKLTMDEAKKLTDLFKPVAELRTTKDVANLTTAPPLTIPENEKQKKKMTY